MKVNIESLDYYGRGIAKIDNIPIFIEDAIPGDYVEIEVTKKKKKFMEGKVIKYIKQSSSRCQFCNIKCGSCQLDNIFYEDQLIFKEQKVKDLIKKFTHENITVKNIISNPNPTNYRNKATFHINNKIGYYKNKTHDIVEIDNCLLVDQKINDLLNIIKNNVNLNNIYEIVLRASKYTNDTMVVFKIKNNINEEAIVEKLKNEFTSIIIYHNKYKTIWGKNYIIEKINNLDFIISPDSFFQVNTACAHKLYNQVLKYADLNRNDKVLDLYCGTGSISLYLSKFCKEITGIEINKYAIEDANKNKELNNIKNVKFICNDAGKSVENLNDNYDVIIVDPPRAGLDKNTINYLNNSKCKKIIYVSCDPVTLARDLNLLKEKYNILEITPVDMFSYTYHVECVCVLKLK